MCSVLREMHTAVNATLDGGNGYRGTGQSSPLRSALLVRKVTQGQLKDWL